MANNPNAAKNLTPFQPGQSGNPEGRPKGIENWSTIVRELLDDDKLADKLLAKQPGWWSSLPSKNAGNAIVVAMMIQALNGDVKAATWLRRTGYGDKLDITSGDKPVKTVNVFDMRLGTQYNLTPVAPPAPKRKRAPAKKKAATKAAKVSKSTPLKRPKVNKTSKTVHKSKANVNKKAK